MAAERPGENYYEHQFGDRIRGISKGGTKPPPAPARSGSGGKTAGGAGVVVVIVIIAVRALIGVGSSSSSRHSYTYTPPPQVQFQPPPQVQFQPPIGHRRMRLNQQPGEVRLDEVQIRPGSPLLTPEDVAYVPAFCFRLQKKGPTTELTPDRRVFDRLDADGRKLVAEIANNIQDEPAPEKRDAALEALNRILDDPEFFDANYFRDVELSDDLRARLAEWTDDAKVKTLPEARRINRALFEASFPRQVIPRSAGPLTEEKRKEYVSRATVEAQLLGIK